MSYFFFAKKVSKIKKSKKGGDIIISVETDDAVIIEKVLSGDVNSFEIIVKKYEKMIYNLAFTKTRSRENALDISQECFLRAYKMLRSYRTDSAFSTWIYRICQNLIFDFYRKEKKIKTVSLSGYGEDEEKETEIADTSGEPSENIIRAERIEKIREIINALPDDLREIIILRDFRDISYADIAEMLDIEIGTVKSRLNRAREKLKNYIIKNNPNGELF
ncbi:MAG: sigma-70 family RNA polymerase sigma factor [Oscillospiraceae bacterium]|nr:sigma-70 family RNA polymerase sigma factor [Oscillospiraceae bacterium]